MSASVLNKANVTILRKLVICQFFARRMFLNIRPVADAVDAQRQGRQNWVRRLADVADAGRSPRATHPLEVPADADRESGVTGPMPGLVFPNFGYWRQRSQSTLTLRSTLVGRA